MIALAGVVAVVASASAQTRTFAPEDSGQGFEVPAGVSTITVEAIGGRGGQASEHYCHGEGSELGEVREAAPGDGSEAEPPEGEPAPPDCYGEAPLGEGGSGAKVLATLDVSPGEDLSVHFGGGGEGGTWPTGPEADYATYGEGGGGSELLGAASAPLVVAGGGGGGGSGRGGSTEGFVGGDGEGDGAGKGGTTSSGGAGGTEGFPGGKDGSRGQGGGGFLGGGGGGGYYGGGGGFFGGGGGGAGSSFIVQGASGGVGSGAGLAQQIVITYTVLAARCSANSGTIRVSPGLTSTPAVQTMKIKGTLSDCAGQPFTAAKYAATLKTAGPVACSVLHAAGEPASGAARYTWTPKAKASKGTLDIALSETPEMTLSGQLESGPYSPLGVSGTVSENFTNAATCGVPQGKRGIVKAVTKATFSGSELDFG